MSKNATNAKRQPKILESVVEPKIVPPIVEQSNTGDDGRKKLVTMTQEEFAGLKLSSTSAKIRYLWAEGYTRSAIANFLGKRYQHVRNVLITPLKRGPNDQAAAPAEAEAVEGTASTEE